MASFARWCFRHRIIVIIAWIAVLASVGAAGLVVGSNYSNSFALPGTESSKALDLLGSALPQQAGESVTIVWHAVCVPLPWASSPPRGAAGSFAT
jgi:RND superfamily putative drug exporter